jgi:hypothetical protein
MEWVAGSIATRYWTAMLNGKSRNPDDVYSFTSSSSTLNNVVRTKFHDETIIIILLFFLGTTIVWAKIYCKPRKVYQTGRPQPLLLLAALLLPAVHCGKK